MLSEVRENEAEEKQMKEIKKKSHIENYSLVFLLLSFLVFVATFILSRQECSQIHDRPAYNYEGVIQKEEIIETAAKNLEEDIREQKIKTCKNQKIQKRNIILVSGIFRQFVRIIGMKCVFLLG